jgi:hypothetical protein
MASLIPSVAPYLYVSDRLKLIYGGLYMALVNQSHAHVLKLICIVLNQGAGRHAWDVSFALYLDLVKVGVV